MAELRNQESGSFWILVPETKSGLPTSEFSGVTGRVATGILYFP
ncbi:MAG: hypothetical protein AAFY20_15045 [Cyanobacteria bacterium J06639_14]